MAEIKKEQIEDILNKTTTENIKKFLRIEPMQADEISQELPPFREMIWKVSDEDLENSLADYIISKIGTITYYTPYRDEALNIMKTDFPDKYIVVRKIFEKLSRDLDYVHVKGTYSLDDDF